MHPIRAKRMSALLARHGWQVQRSIDGKPNPVHVWNSDPDFALAMDGVRERTLVHDPACYVLYRSALGVRALDGDAAEVGVYRGGTALLLSRTLPDAVVHLYDTFTGMPESDPEHDLHAAGDFSDTSLESVQRLLAGRGNVALHPGFFPDTASGEASTKFRFVHVDVDIYRSVLDCASFFYPRMVPGGVLVFDDYGWSSTVGARVAVDEFFAAVPEVPVYLPTGQAIVFRQESGPSGTDL